MRLFSLFSALLCVAVAQQGYPRRGTQGNNGTQGYPRGGPNGNRLSVDGFNNDNEFNGYPDNRLDEKEEAGSIPGRAGVDYPAFDQVPETSFKCDQQEFPGYYADPEAQCQAFHICQTGGQMDSFLCPNGTIFNQRYLVCDWYYNFDCTLAEGLWRETNEAVVNAMREADERITQEKASQQQQQGGYNFNAQSNDRNAFGDFAAGQAGNAGYQYNTPSSSNQNGNRGSSNNNRVSGNGQRGQQSNNGFQQGNNGFQQLSGNDAVAPSSTYGAPANGNRNGNGSNGQRGTNQNGNNRNGAATPSSTYGAPGNGNGNRNGGRNNGAGSNGNGSTGNNRNGGSTTAISTQYGAPNAGSRNSNRQSNRQQTNSNGFSNRNGYSNGNGASSTGRVGAAPSELYGAPSTGGRNGNSRSSNGNGHHSAGHHASNGNGHHHDNGQHTNDIGRFSSTTRSGPGFASASASFNSAPSSQYGLPAAAGNAFGARNGNGNLNSGSQNNFNTARPKFALADPLTSYQPSSNGRDFFGAEADFEAPRGSDDFGLTAPSDEYGAPLSGDALDRSYLPPAQ